MISQKGLTVFTKSAAHGMLCNSAGSSRHSIRMAVRNNSFTLAERVQVGPPLVSLLPRGLKHSGPRQIQEAFHQSFSTIIEEFSHCDFEVPKDVNEKNKNRRRDTPSTSSTMINRSKSVPVETCPWLWGCRLKVRARRHDYDDLEPGERVAAVGDGKGKDILTVEPLTRALSSIIYSITKQRLRG